MIRDIPVMRRPVGQHAHPLLIDQVVYVKAGRTEAETERRIAEACAASAIDPARAVACVEAPPAGKQRAGKGVKSAGKPGKGASGPDFAPSVHGKENTPCHSPN